MPYFFLFPPLPPPPVMCKRFICLTVIQAYPPDLSIPKISFFRRPCSVNEEERISLTGGDRLIFYFLAADKGALAGQGG